MFVQATLGGYTTIRCIRMTPPDIAHLVLTSTPVALATGEATAITATAAPIGVNHNLLPAETELTFFASVDPPDTPLAYQPRSTTLGASGMAAVSVFAADGAQLVTVSVTAQVPASPRCPDEPADEADHPGPAVDDQLAIPFVPAPDASIDAPPPDAAPPDAPPLSPPDAEPIDAPTPDAITSDAPTPDARTSDAPLP
jgi:hypothetical protein